MTDRQSTHGHFCWGWGQKHYECAVREIERLRSILIDLKDWDCDVSGGFLSIPMGLRRRMQEAIDAQALQQDADPCPQCIPGGVCKTPTCGRLLAARAQPDAGLDVEAVLRRFLTVDGFIAECDIQHIVAALTTQPAISGYTCTVPDDCETLHWRGQILSMNELASVAQPAAAPPPAAARVDVTWPLSILEAGNWREVYMGTKHMRLEVSYPYEAWERLMAALAAAQQQQPAEGEEIMVNTPYDVFILPLQPSGLDGKGPRFVVHVPGPEARGGGKAAPPRAPVGATLSNPWTGKPRDYRDVDSDPEGVLCVEPGAPLKAAPSTPVRVSWADFWIAQGDWPTANDYAAFEKAEQWLLAQQPAAVDDPDVQAAEVEALRAEVAEWKRVAAAQAELHDKAEARAERLAEALRELGEREQRDEALLRQALEVLSRAHQAAMVQTLKARIPECAEFGGIAQDLDFVAAALRERLGEGAEP
jgi:hypothetical protein